MTVIPAKPATLGVAGPVGASPGTVLVTTEEVLFSTAAAALPLEAPRTARRFANATHGVAAAFRGMFLTSRADARPARRHYPSRLEFLERSAMSREMDRL